MMLFFLLSATALGASESGTLPGTAPAEALHTFTLDSGASRCFFRDSTTLTPLPAPVPVRLADPSGGPVVARSSTILPCPAVPSGSLSGLHLPSFSTNLVSTAALQDAMVTTTTPGGQRASNGHVHSSARAESVHTRYQASSNSSVCSGVCVRSGSRLLLVSPLVAPDSFMAPLPGSPLPATPSWHALPSSCLWSTQGLEHYFLLVVDDYTRYTMIFPLRSKGEVVDVLIPWTHTIRLQLRERFGQDLPVLCLHSDRGVMEVARTSMIHAAAPHFLWPFAVRYATHQLNLLPRFSLPQTSPTLRSTGEVGNASVFRVWGSRAFVHDTSADKLSARAIPCVFHGFVPDAPGWQFYHPTSRRIFPSQDVTSDESVPFYRLFPYPSAPPPPPPLFLAPGPPPVDPLPPQGPSPSGVSQVDPLLGTAPVEPGGAELAGVETGGVEPGGAESEGAESRGAEPRGAALSGGPAGASPRLSPQQLREWLVWRARLWTGATGAGGAGDAAAGGAGVTAGAGSTGGTAAAGPGGARTRGAGAVGTGGFGSAGAGDPTEPGAAGAGGSCAGGAGSGGAGVGGTGTGGAGAAGAGAVDPRAGGAGGTARPRPYFVPLLQQVLGVPSSPSLTPPLLCPPLDQSQPPLLSDSPLPTPSPYTEQSSGLTERCEPTSRPVSPVRTTPRVPRSRPPSVPSTHAMALYPSSVPLRVPLPAPPGSSLPEVPDPESDRARAASPTVSRLFATAVTDPSFESAAASALVAELLDFAATCRLDYATALVAESASASPPSVGGECALGTDVLESKQEDFECLAAAVPRFASMLLAPEGDPDAPDIPTPRSYAEAITGFSQRQGVDFFQTFSPTPKMTTLQVLLHVTAQRDYELHSLDFSTAFLQGSMHEEIWLRHPPGFTGSFPGTQWSLRRPVYGLRQAPREWHDTLKTTLVALGLAPSTTDPLLFLRTDTSLPPLYILVYVDDLVFATVDTKALTLVKSELQKRHTWTNLGELHSNLGLQITRDRARRTITLTQSHMMHQVLQRFGFQFSSPQPSPLSTSHSLSAPPSDESVEPRGPYLELVGCLITSGMGLVLGGRGPVVLTCHADASWVDDSATQRSSQGYTFSLVSGSVSWRFTRSSSVLSSSCEAEIYAGAMAAQELRWLTYLLTDLGEQPCSPRVLYVDNKAMIALCQEHRLEHRTKHIAL
ncbi:unnamed protein product [Closterium sp. NIES-54]